jgi:hypothetical protein
MNKSSLKIIKLALFSSETLALYYNDELTIYNISRMDKFNIGRYIYVCVCVYSEEFP